MHCPNCGHAVNGRYCPACGQATGWAPVTEELGATVTHSPRNGQTSWTSDVSDSSASPSGPVGSGGYGYTGGYEPNSYVPSDSYDGSGGYAQVHQDTGPAVAGGWSPAPLSSRFLAGLVDLLLTAAAAAAVYGVGRLALLWWYRLASDPATANQWLGPAAVLVLVPSLLIAILLYGHVYRVGSTGRSWGKAAAGVVVINDGGDPIGTDRAFLRMFVYVLPLVPLTCFLDGSGLHRTWADLAAGSRVVQVP